MKLVEMSNHRIVELWNGEVGVVVESSKGGILGLVESSNRRMVEW